MSGFSLSISRPSGRALVVGSAACRPPLVDAIGRAGYQPAEAEDPYSAMAELCRRPLAYRAVVLSLGSLYQEELELIAAVKRRYSHVEIWLGQSDGRPAALAEALRLGADGLVSDDGLHRFGAVPKEPEVRVVTPPAPAVSAAEAEVAAANVASAALPGPAELAASPQEQSFLDNPSNGEPILTAEELRALLEDPPFRSLSRQEE